MELTEIKGSLFGYKKKDVCKYISELNELQSAELEAKTAKAEAAAAEYEKKIKDLDEVKAELESKNAELNVIIESLKGEIDAYKVSCAQLETTNKDLNDKCEKFESEVAELEKKSEVISTAIINAEKYATSTINDANVRAKEMIGEAEERVSDEVKRLETAKTYISEVRVAVEAALKKIDAELGSVESNITEKEEDIYSGTRKTTAKEKFGMFFKKA